MLNGSYWFECACHSAEDTLNFVLHKGEDKEIYLTIFLDNGTLLKRLWLGLKYIFGYKCKYGHFNCWTLLEEDVGKLKKMIEDFENLNGENICGNEDSRLEISIIQGGDRPKIIWAK